MNTLSTSLRDLNLFVLHKQGLYLPSGAPTLPETTAQLIGLHAKRPQSPYLSLAARLPDFHPHDLDAAMYEQRTLLRAHSMRGTVYLLPLDQYPVVLSASAGQLDGMYRRAFQTLEHVTVLERDIVELVTAAGALTFEQINDALEIPIDKRDLYRIVNHLCTGRVLVKARVTGSWRSNVYTYDLLTRWQPAVPPPNEDRTGSITTLVEWYVATYGPVTRADLAWWTGCTQGQIGKALAALQAVVTTVTSTVLGADVVIARADLEVLSQWRPSAEHQVTFLPSFDPYVIAYRDRDRYIYPHDYAKIFKGVAGLIEPVVLLDGFIVGSWKYQAKPDGVDVTLFQEVPTIPLAVASRKMATFILAADAAYAHTEAETEDA